MTDLASIATPTAEGRAIIAKSAAGTAFESRPGGAAALARIALLRAGIPARLITTRFVDLILRLVATSTTPCHVVGTAVEAARQVRAALADNRGRFPVWITEICDAVDITAE